MVAVNERDLSSTSGRPGRSRPGCVIIRFLLVCCLVVAGLATGVAATTATAGAVTPTSTWNEQSPATSPPAYKECTTPVTTDADGTVTPLQCADGAINVAAWQHYAQSAGSILGLGTSASRQQVISAICSATATLSTPVLQDAYRLAFIYYGWSYGSGLATTTLVTDPSSCG